MALAVRVVVHRVGGKDVHLMLTISMVVGKGTGRSVDGDLVVVDTQSTDLSVEAKVRNIRVSLSRASSRVSGLCVLAKVTQREEGVIRKVDLRHKLFSTGCSGLRCRNAYSLRG